MMSRARFVARKLRGLLRLIRDRLLLVPFSIASLVVPRDRRLWLFGSWKGTRFADNPKHLFLHCHSDQGCAQVRAVWLSARHEVVQEVRALGLPAYLRNSLKGIWYALRAGVYVFDCRVWDVHPLASFGAMRLNLWHGVPLKRIERDIEQSTHDVHRAHFGPWYQRALLKIRRPELTERYHAVLATSPDVAARFARAFGVRDEQLLVLGYPRTDPLLDEARARRWLSADERTLFDDFAGRRAAGERILLYMPTFRDWNNSAERRIPIDWERMDAQLALGGGTLYLKLHPEDRAGLPPIDRYSRIKVLAPSVDVYPFLCQIDALITDYSSIHVDYLLLDRPMLYFAYDLEEYQRLSRSLYDQYEDVTPGPKAGTPAELTGLIGALLADYDGMSAEWRDARSVVRARFHSHPDAGASSRLVEALLARVG